MMRQIAFHIDRTEWAGRTKILTLATSDASFRIDGWHLHMTSIRSGVVHHLDRTGRAMARTSTARIIVDNRDAILLNPYRMTDVDGGLILTGNRLYGSRRTDIGATCTLRTAKTSLV